MTRPASSTRPVRRLLTYADVADYLGISVRQAKLLAAAGEFPKVSIGARVLFDRCDVDAFVERTKGAAS